MDVLLSQPTRRHTIINAAITPPAIFPLPPVEEIPPNTAMAMASISKPFPVVVLAPKDEDRKKNSAKAGNRSHHCINDHADLLHMNAGIICGQTVCSDGIYSSSKRAFSKNKAKITARITTRNRI